MLKKKIRILLLLLLLFGVLGYFREFFFVHTNRIMYGIYYNQDAYEYEPMPVVMKPLYALSYNQLYYLKYVFTIFWIGVFFAANYLAIKKLTNNTYLIRILLYAYGGMLVMAGISMVYGYLVSGNLREDEYTFSRWLMGIAQSPIICLILLASEKLYNQSFRT